MATIKAIYENGVFKPVEPVALPDRQRVEIDVRPVPSVRPRQGPSEDLLRWAGAIDTDVPDLCDHLDDYLGAALAQDLRADANG